MLLSILYLLFFLAGGVTVTRLLLPRLRTVLRVYLGLSLGVNFSSALGCDTVAGINGAIAFTIGSVTIKLSGLAVAAIVGILVNAILPGNDYTFPNNEQGDKSVNFKV